MLLVVALMAPNMKKGTLVLMEISKFLTNKGIKSFQQTPILSFFYKSLQPDVEDL